MQLDIPYYMRQVLREQKAVAIPGIGRLVLKQTGATFNSDKSSLLPPVLNLFFEDEANGAKDALLEYITDYDGISLKKAEKAISEYSNLVLDALANKGVLSIGGVGKFISDSDSGKISFLPTVSKFTKIHQELPAISSEPIVRIAEENGSVDYAVDTSAVVQKEEEDNYLPWWIPILAGTLVGLIYIMSANGCFSSDKKSTSETLGLLNTTKSDSIELVDETGSTIVDDTVSEIDEKYKEVDNMLGDNSSNNNKLNEVLAHLDTNEGGNMENESSVRATTKVDYASLIPASGKCRIVVGSFKKAKNAYNMMSMVDRAGYNSFRVDHNGLTRVGLVFDCSGVDLAAYLQNIRHELDDYAWYLDPELRVEYE